MAEEKKETTKKTTSKKKEPIEEVKVEKRFCTKCGKELKEGEVCSCSAEGENSSNPEAIVNTDVIVNTGKDLWNTMYLKNQQQQLVKKQIIKEVIKVLF